MVAVFREVRRVLRDDGTVWLNLGSSYWGGKGQSGKASPEKQAARVARGESFNIPEAQIGGPKLTAPGDGRHDVYKPKDLVMIPSLVALALQADGWWLRSEITWCKKSPMPESVRDRPTSATEKIYLLTKNKSYYYDQEAVREACRPSSIERSAYSLDSNNSGFHKDARTGSSFEKTRAGMTMGEAGFVNPAGRNMWNYWILGPEPYKGSHFAVFPTEIPRRAILAGSSQRGCCPECGAGWVRCVERSNPTRTFPDVGKGIDERKADGTNLRAGELRTVTTGWEPSCSCGHDHEPVPCIVLDPFAGSGTVGVVCQELGRHFVGLDLSMDYLQLARERTGAKALDEWNNGVAADEADLTGLPMFAELL